VRDEKYYYFSDFTSVTTCRAFSGYVFPRRHSGGDRLDGNRPPGVTLWQVERTTGYVGGGRSVDKRLPGLASLRSPLGRVT
jgi:hypothetical protein